MFLFANSKKSHLVPAEKGAKYEVGATFEYKKRETGYRFLTLMNEFSQYEV